MIPFFQTKLERMILSDVGAEHAVSLCTPMAGGYAGLTWGFDVTGPDGSSQSFVLKMSPTGVPRHGSTDIFRQAKLLQSLNKAGQPVPSIRWASGEDRLLGAPFIVMERLIGRSLVVWEPHPQFLADPEGVPSLWLQTASALGVLHGLDWKEALPDWELPVTLNSELDRWAGLLRHAHDADWIAHAHSLLDLLKRTSPQAPPIGVVHGDAQPSNALFDQGRLVGLIDWDLAGIGPLGIDVGWLLMIADTNAWTEDWKPIRGPSRGALIESYRQAGGPVDRDFGWYQAFAHFRISAITGLNLKLHRTGRRVDPAWERFASSIPRLLERGPGLIDV